MRTNLTKKLGVVGLFSLLPIHIAVAQALESDEQKAQADEALQIEQIMVTAQKRGEDLQEVPLALSVISSKDLERENLQTFQDIQYSVPNLSMVATTPFATTVNMRGIPSNPNGVFNSGTSPGLGIYVDGVVYARATGFNQELSNIERVEVLRGPQGTLFGQNTNLGVVSITTKKPSDLTEAKVKIDLGNYNLRRANVYATTPLIEDVLSASISLFKVKQDGYINNLADGSELGSQDRKGGRLQVRYTPTTNLTIDLSAEVLKGDSTPPAVSLVSYDIGLGYIGLLGQGTTPEAFMTNDIRDAYANSNRYFAERDNWGADATISYQFDNGYEIKSITAKKDYDSLLGMDTDATSIDLNYSLEGEDNSQFTQEFQLISPADRDLRFVSGLYYLRNEAVNNQAFITGSGIYGIPTGLPDGYPQSIDLYPGAGVTIDGSLTTESTALFTNVSYDFSDAINGFVGIRYSDVTKDMTYAQGGYETSLTDLYGIYLLDYIDVPKSAQSQKDDFISWTVGLSGRVDENINVYAKIARGYKEGGYSFRPQSTDSLGGDINNPQIDFGREEVTSYEMGMKSELLDRRMRLNLALFYLDYEDIQSLVVDDNGVNRVVNGPSAVSQGAEAEVRYLLTKALTAKATIGYADANFGDFENCHATDDCTDNQLPGAAKWTNTLSLNYLETLNDNWEVFGGIDYSYRSEIQSDARNLAATELDSSELVNAQLGVVSADGQWEVMLWTKNLFDDESKVNQTDSATSTLSFSESLYAMPRTFGLSVTYTYM
jgi:iron complex outermembrane receptor protein